MDPRARTNTWMLVPADEVGLLARLRPAVRQTTRGVLVALEQRPPVPGAQFGLGHAGTLRWFGGGLTADDVARLIEHVRTGRFDALAAGLAHRRLGPALQR